MFEILVGKSDFSIVRNIIMRGLALIYLCAFVSLYVQIQGLFGDEGIYPAKNFMQKLKETYKDEFSFFSFPNLLLFSDKINAFVTTLYPQLHDFSKEENTLHFICLLGIIISLTILINRRIFYNKLGFLLLFVFYLTFYMSGQIFVSYEMDFLLLEAGFIGIFLAPFLKSNLSEVSSSEETSLYLMRFLIFKYIYGTGVSKLLGGCEQWSTLNALNTLTETIPLPHIFSYILHQYSDFFKKSVLSLVFIFEVIVINHRSTYLFYFLTVFLGDSE